MYTISKYAYETILNFCVMKQNFLKVLSNRIHYWDKVFLTLTESMS